MCLRVYPSLDRWVCAAVAWMAGGVCVRVLGVCETLVKHAFDVVVIDMFVLYWNRHHH